jgi:competence ComEA-like helix-hairpin-helix protein
LIQNFGKHNFVHQDFEKVTVFNLIKKSFTYFLILILTGCQDGCQQKKLEHATLQPLPQDPLIQVYFNHAETSEYQEGYRDKKRLGDDLEKQIADTIKSAESEVDVAVQELRLPRIAQAIAEKHKAGVKVRLIIENTYSRPWSSLSAQEVKKLKPRESQKYKEYRNFVDINQDGKLDTNEVEQRDALVILDKAKVTRLDDTFDGSRGSDLMHHKFVVVDNRFVIVTSANFTLSDIHGDYTKSDTLGNANNLLKIDSPEIARVFTEEFNLMWGSGSNSNKKFGLKKPIRAPRTIKLGDSAVTVNFSPTSPTLPWINSSNGLINTNLSTAAKSVDIALFVFSDQRLANILEGRHQQNVKIRALIEKSFAYRSYSEGLDMMGFALSDKCRYEIDNKPWQNPITTVAIPSLPPGDLLHHKFGIIDNQTVITGSHNWSEAANDGNDETLLVIQNPVIAAHYTREFERLYKKSQPGLPQRIQQKIKSQQKECPKIDSPSTIENKSVQVNLNTATLAEIETLPGIGKKIAQRIIDARQQKPFTSLKDLQQVKGLSNSKLQKLQGYVSW